MYSCACCLCSWSRLRRYCNRSFLQRHCSCTCVLHGVLLSIPFVLLILVIIGITIAAIYNDPCLTGQNDLTDIHNAIKNGMVEKGLELLNKSKVEPDCNGETTLQVAAFYGYNNLVEKLIELKSDIDYQDHNGQTALIKASINNHIDVVVTLIVSGADLDIQDKILETALIHASWEGHVTVVEELTRCKVSLNIRERIGETALYNAALTGNLEIVKVLTEQGRANICIADLNGKTPTMAADSSGHIDIAQYLRNHTSCTIHPS